MHNPLGNIPAEKRRQIFLPLLAATLIIMVTMNVVGARLSTAAAPGGIVSFEFAATPARAQAMIDSWDHPAQLRAAFIQGLDFLFPPVYATTIALACVWVAGTLKAAGKRLAGVGTPLAWGQWLAALLDYIENICLLALLFGRVASPWPEIAAVCAGVKFTLIVAGMLYGLYGFGVWVGALFKS